MYFICLAILGICFAVNVNAVENSCTCEGDSMSSALICTLGGPNDLVNISEDYCKTPIRTTELQLLRHTYLSSSVIPSIKVFRLGIIGEYLKEVSEDAFVGHEDNLEFLEIKNAALSEIPVAALQRLHSLKSLNLAGNSLSSINCSLGGVSLKQMILFDNQISNIHTCAFPLSLMTLSLKNNYVGMLNGSLKFHDLIEWLFISRNRITSLEGELEGMVSLTSLDASWNKIGTIGTTPTQLIMLHSLKLSHNRISKLGNSLNGFSFLESLDLSYNDLEVLSAGMFANLTRLMYLSLSANSLRYLDDDVFELLITLENLEISNNMITNLDGKLGKLSTLKRLDASWNKIKIIGKLMHLTSLEELNLSHNRIVNLGDSLNGLSKLGRLDLSDNNIKKVDDGVFNQLSNLQILSLSMNELGSLDGNVFVPLTKLKSLDLSFNGLQTLDAVVVPGFMGFSAETTSEESRQGNCLCEQKNLSKTLRIEGNILACYINFIEMTARLEEQDIELTGC